MSLLEIFLYNTNVIKIQFEFLAFSLKEIFNAVCEEENLIMKKAYSFIRLLVISNINKSAYKGKSKGNDVFNIT